MTLRDEVARILAENGFTDAGGNPHGWRCDYPERYSGYCTCATDAVNDVVDFLVSRGVVSDLAGLADEKEE